MKEIVLPGGEVLIDNSFPEHTECDLIEVTTNKRGNAIGIHKNCGNAFWLRKRSNDNAICCFGCLYVVERVPSEICTYAGLRQWCAEEITRIGHHAESIRQLQNDHAVYGECLSPEALEQSADEDKAAKELVDYQERMLHAKGDEFGDPWEAGGSENFIKLPAMQGKSGPFIQ